MPSICLNDSTAVPIGISHFCQVGVLHGEAHTNAEHNQIAGLVSIGNVDGQCVK